MTDKEKKVEEDSFKNYFEQMDNANDEDVYKIYENYAHNFGVDIKDQNDPGFWKMYGESNLTYGKITVYGSKESLEQENKYINNRSKQLNNIFDKETKNEIIKKFPSKCDKCGFNRFFGIKINYSSMNNFISIFCLNCKKELVDLND